MIHKIFLSLWAVWCAIVFVTMCTILFPILFLAVLSRSERLIYAAHFVPTRLARATLFLFGIRLEIRGEEYINAAGQYIYISNHRSLLDAVIAGAVIPNYVKFLGKTEMLKWPVLGYLLAKFYVPVQRHSKDDRTYSLAMMEEKMKAGASFFICPEGSCNTTDQFFTHFYNGAFQVSARTGVPLVPLTFVGSAERWPRSEWLIHPGKLMVYFHGPVPAGEFQDGKLEAGKQKVLEIIRQDLLKHYPAGKY